MHHLDSLNSQQKKAVLATEGPVIIVAGAGAGKTKTITHRILHLIQSGVSGENILAITFTNKAAKEMRDRVENLLQETAGHHRIPFVSTFHALGVQILRENAPLLGISRHFSIYDKADSKKAVKDALVYLGVDPKETTEKVQAIISAEKGRGVTSAEYAAGGAFDYTSELTKKAWVRYEEILKRDGALDFDDLLLKTLKLLSGNAEILERYQDRFLYIHIDEYQDTNKVQNAIVEFLAKKHRNICVVGDTDQNIYSWRGAEIKNMLHFERNYPEAQTFFLEQNYRSTKTILGAANNIIEKNTYRIPKKLFTENGEGEKIGLFEARNETDEAHFVALTAKHLIEENISPDEIGVLYRANFQSRALEEAFLAYGVPYQMLGTKFFERKEIKDVVSLVRASLNPGSLGDFCRVINVPPRGIGKVTVDKIIDGEEESLPAGTKSKISSFRSSLAEFKKIIETEKPSRALRYIIERSGMEKMYENRSEEDAERFENIMELVSLSTRYDHLPPEEGMSMFLTDAALASDQDSLMQSQKGVKLMTVHSAKGLEFDYVCITGLEAGLFPHDGWRSGKKTGEEAEEERRLFYVALTRARKKLFLTWASMRTIFGSLQANAPSEFIGDIPDKYIEHENYSQSRSSFREPLFKIEF